MSEWFSLDASEMDEFQKMMDDYGDAGLQTINEVLHGEGAQVIQDEIQNLLPSSGRTWKRKKAPARSAQPFTHTDEMLAVTTKTKSAYNYLYFPDDGSNTRHHAGNQQFMMHGAEDAASDIIELCMGKLLENF